MIAYCPSCYRPSRVPPIDHELLQCPHCAEEFVSHLEHDHQLSSFQANVEDTLHAGGIHSAFNEEVPSERSNDEFEIFVEPDEPRNNYVDDGKEFELQPVSARSRGNSSDDGDLQLNAAARPRRKKQKSPIGGLIGVVFGGLAALPIATAIMWYGLGRDPFQIAPKVAEYAPWMVPERLAGGSLAQRSARSSSQQVNPTGSDANSHFNDEQLRQANEAPTPPASEPQSNIPPDTKLDKPNEASSLPFVADGPTSEIDAKALLAYKSLERSFDAMLETKDTASVSNFLDSWQRYIDLAPNANLISDANMIKLQERLVDLNDRALQKELASGSRARVASIQPDQTQTYIDVFELAKIEVQSTSQDVLLIPSGRTPEPIKSMTVLGALKQFPLDSTNASNQVYLLFGLTKKDKVDDKTTFHVLMSRRL